MVDRKTKVNGECRFSATLVNIKTKGIGQCVWQVETHRPTGRHHLTTSRKCFNKVSPVSVVWLERNTGGLTPRSLKRDSHYPVSRTVQQDIIPFSTQLLYLIFDFLSTVGLRQRRPASDASEHCVTLAVAAVVNVDLESWQLLRVQLVLSFPPDIRGPDNAWSLRQELNLPVCGSQINRTGKQWRESAGLLIWFGCRMFLAFHTQVILGIFCFGGWVERVKPITQSLSVCLCAYVTLQVNVCNCVHLFTYVSCKVLTQHAMQTDTAASSCVRTWRESGWLHLVCLNMVHDGSLCLSGNGFKGVFVLGCHK